MQGAQLVGTDRNGKGQDYRSECGDQNCFLFNLTQNLRFNAIKGRGPYQSIEINSQQGNVKTISLGGQALQIDNQLRSISSQIEGIHDNDCKFVYANCLHASESDKHDHGKVDSLLPGKANNRIERPTAIEVYVL